jgi:hypothetical protein
MLWFVVTHTTFDQVVGQEQNFVFQPIPDTNKQRINLTGMGPKTLLSQYTTEEHPVFNLSFEVIGNLAIEIGLVDTNTNIIEKPTYIHKDCKIGAYAKYCSG